MPSALGEKPIDRQPQTIDLKPLVRRQLLHAWRLGVTPRSGEPLTWEALFLLVPKLRLAKLIDF